MAENEELTVFAQRLKRLHQRRCISCEALSELCGLSKNVIGCYERRERFPSVRSLIALADFFDVSTDYLLGRDSYLTRS